MDVLLSRNSHNSSDFSEQHSLFLYSFHATLKIKMATKI